MEIEKLNKKDTIQAVLFFSLVLSICIALKLSGFNFK